MNDVVSPGTHCLALFKGDKRKKQEIKKDLKP